jgi:hypothetical protein
MSAIAAKKVTIVRICVTPKMLQSPQWFVEMEVVICPARCVEGAARSLGNFVFIGICYLGVEPQ